MDSMSAVAYDHAETQYACAARSGYVASGLALAEAAGTDWPRHFTETRQTSALICTGDIAHAPGSDTLTAMARAAGLRVLDVLPIPTAANHVSGLIALDAVILRCSGQEPGLDALLAHLNSVAETDNIDLLVITDLDGLDRVHALVRSRAAIILCEPEPTDMAVALLALTSHSLAYDRLHDINKDAEGDRFDLLSDQLLRLNRMIEALVHNKAADDSTDRPWGHLSPTIRSPVRGYAHSPETATEQGNELRAHQVRALLRARRLRDQLLAPDLFADPAWDILLDLLAARLENSRVSVSSLCIAAAVPPTTALRWIRQLTDRGLLERHADPRDGRRIFIALSDRGADAVARWFRESRTHLQAALRHNEGNHAA